MSFKGFKNPIGAESQHGEGPAEPFSKLEKGLNEAGDLLVLLTKGLKIESMSPEEKVEMMEKMDQAIVDQEERIGRLAERFSKEEGGEAKITEGALREEEYQLRNLKGYKKHLAREIAGDKIAA